MKFTHVAQSERGFSPRPGHGRGRPGWPSGAVGPRLAGRPLEAVRSGRAGDRLQVTGAAGSKFKVTRGSELASTNFKLNGSLTRNTRDSGLGLGPTRTSKFGWVECRLGCLQSTKVPSKKKLGICTWIHELGRLPFGVSRFLDR